jgi:hypothetical protein
VWSQTGVGTQMQITSATATAPASLVKWRRPLASPRRKVPSWTPGTHSSPAASAFMRPASVSMPSTVKPASAAAHANDSPT